MKPSKEVLKARTALLVAMDKDLRQNLGDEDLFDIWLRDGVPDGAVESGSTGILVFISSREDCFADTCEAYRTIITEDEDGDKDADLESLGGNWW